MGEAERALCFDKYDLNCVFNEEYSRNNIYSIEHDVAETVNQFHQLVEESFTCKKHCFAKRLPLVIQQNYTRVNINTIALFAFVLPSLDTK